MVANRGTALFRSASKSKMHTGSTDWSGTVAARRKSPKRKDFFRTDYSSSGPPVAR